MPGSSDRGNVQRIARCDLSVTDESWTETQAHAADVDRHWAAREAENSRLFNGPIVLMRSHTLADGVITGSFVRTDFKTYLFWRDAGMPDWGVRDAFGSALLRSAEGHLLLGRQGEGHVNAGFVYPPGGFLDSRDIGPDGAIDLDAAIARELEEETGIRPGTLARTPGYIVASTGPQISIAVELRSSLPAAELKASIMRHIAAEADPELVDIVVIRSLADLTSYPTPAYARLLLGVVLGA